MQKFTGCDLKSKMNGHLIPGTPIAVDFWNIRKCASANLFFLTHIHSDHTVGLTSSWSQPIYCSKLTGKLLCLKFSLSNDLIRPLELHSPTLIPLDPSHTEMMTVTTINANHCPGSVMFLFQGYFGNILYTGDFRYASNMFVDSLISNVSVDVLYLDNTYCDPLCVFDTQKEEKGKVFEIIESYPEHDILLGMQSIGKPDLLIDIAKHFQEYIAVPLSMYKYLEILEVPNVFQVDTPEHECRLRVVPTYYISAKLFGKLTRPTIAVLATALYVGLEGTPYSNQDSVYIVPYSDHSSYVELQMFVKQIRPGRIVPIVGREAKGPFKISFATRADMSCFDHFLSKRPQKPFTIPASVNVRNTRSVCQNHLSTSKRRKSSFDMTVTKSVSKGVIFESSPQKNKSESSMRKNVAKSQDDSPDPSGSPVKEAIDQDVTNSGLKKTRPLKKVIHIHVEKPCPLEKTTETIDDSAAAIHANVELPQIKEKATFSHKKSETLQQISDMNRSDSNGNLNPDLYTQSMMSNSNSVSQTNTLNLNPVLCSGAKNTPGLSSMPTGLRSEMDAQIQEKVTIGNNPCPTRVEVSSGNSEADENSEKDTSSTNTSAVSTVYNIESAFQTVKVNADVSIQPQVKTRKRKLPPMFDKEFCCFSKQQCSDNWNSDTRQKELSAKRTGLLGKQVKDVKENLGCENEVNTEVVGTMSEDLSAEFSPALSLLSKTCQRHKSVSDYVGRFGAPGWTFTSCQAVFSEFIKKQRLRYKMETTPLSQIS